MANNDATIRAIKDGLKEELDKIQNAFDEDYKKYYIILLCCYIDQLSSFIDWNDEAKNKFGNKKRIFELINNFGNDNIKETMLEIDLKYFLYKVSKKINDKNPSDRTDLQSSLRSFVAEKFLYTSDNSSIKILEKFSCGTTPDTGASRYIDGHSFVVSIKECPKKLKEFIKEKENGEEKKLSEIYRNYDIFYEELRCGLIHEYYSSFVSDCFIDSKIDGEFLYNVAEIIIENLPISVKP